MLGRLETRNISSREVILTFDVEDISDVKAEIWSLQRILHLLKKYDLRAIFFITGSVAEKIGHFPKILDQMKKHEIGYHSSSHSVKPRIFEYTDVKSYQEGVALSLERETKNIDPISGEVKDEGGILTLRKIFPDKKIVCFRAPQLCWTPPHLDALRKMGFKFDFSADISKRPVFHKGITFYPYPVFIDGIFGKIGYRSPRVIDNRVIKDRPRILLFTVLRERVTVLALHPHRLIFSKYWDPMVCTSPRNTITVKMDFLMLEWLLLQLNMLKRMKLIKNTLNLNESKIKLNPRQIDVKRIYEMSVGYSRKKFHYEPKFLFLHFYNYFLKSKC